MVNLKPLLDSRKILRSLLLVALPALLFYGCAVLVLTRSGYSVLQILRDPATQIDFSSLLGFVSNIGIWLWVSSAAICCFSLVSGVGRTTRGRTELLTLLAMLSLLLAVDDFFLLHERYVHQKGIFLFYAICTISMLVRHYRRILEIDGFSFVLAGLLLGTSVIIDMKQRQIPFNYTQVQLIEEGCKFVGASLWLYFCGQTAAGKKRPA
jgi:hypothetical protein